MGLFNDTEADVRAINDYFKRTPPKTTAAAQLKKQWETWYAGLNAITIKLDTTFQEASNRRNAFDVAQAKNEVELEKTKTFIAQATNNDKAIRPDLYKKSDGAGNFTNQKGVTVASAAPGTISKGARPTIRQGSQGEAVKEWQKIIGVNADGIFGPGTSAATKEWQKDRGLVADGVVGSATWGAALGGQAAPNIPFEVAAVTPVAPATKPASKAPTGTVAQIKTISTPKPTKKPTVTKPAPKPTQKAANKAAKPATQVIAEPKIMTSGLSWQSIKNLPGWAKVTVGGSIAALLGLTVYVNSQKDKF